MFLFQVALHLLNYKEMDLGIFYLLPLIQFYAYCHLTCLKIYTPATFSLSVSKNISITFITRRENVLIKYLRIGCRASQLAYSLLTFAKVELCYNLDFTDCLHLAYGCSVAEEYSICSLLQGSTD